VYSDGSWCLQHAGCGVAWRASSRSPWEGKSYALGQYSKEDADSNAAEMAGILHALRIAKKEIALLLDEAPGTVVLYTDSQWSIGWMTEESGPHLRSR